MESLWKTKDIFKGVIPIHLKRRASYKWALPVSTYVAEILAVTTATARRIEVK